MFSTAIVFYTMLSSDIFIKNSFFMLYILIIFLLPKFFLYSLNRHLLIIFCLSACQSMCVSHKTKTKLKIK